MEKCSLTHIPERLHYTTDKAIISDFYVGDVLYRRVSEESLENPFVSISLIDLSHNIGTNNKTEYSQDSDVLFSIIESNQFHSYPNQYPIPLQIISVNDENKYDKIFECSVNNQLKTRIRLVHDPIKCMYPHCVFQFFNFDGEEEIEITFENYKTTLGHNRYRRIRTLLRQELALMIMRKSISQEPLL